LHVHFGDQAKLVLRFAVAMTCTPSTISDNLYAALRQHFPAAPTRGTLRSRLLARARFNRTLAIAAQGFSDGQICPTLELPQLSEPHRHD
jgi:hypothetical protein